MTSALEVEQVKPLSFLIDPFIHDENKKLLDAEHARYHPLTWAQRWRLGIYVAYLRRRLRNYNRLIIERDRLAQRALTLKAALDQTEEQGERRRLIRQGRQCLERGRDIKAQLAQLTEDHGRYQHYNGWLEYERLHHDELKKRERDERAIRRGMDKEAKWLKSLMIDVFKSTRGCHLVVTDGKGKETYKAPKFFRAQIGPEAHYFWVKTSSRTLFGYHWKLPRTVNVDALIEEHTINNLKAATRRDVKPIWTDQGQLVFRVSRLDSPDALPTRVLWRDTREFYPEKKHDFLPFCVGMDEHHKFRWKSFAEDKHVLVGGMSDSGKSNLVNCMIGTIALTHSPDEVRFVLIDQKGGMEFTHWADLPHLLWDVGKVIEDVVPILSRVVDVMRKRMLMMEAVKKKKLEHYNRIAEQKLPRIVVVIDEMNNFIELGALTAEIHNLIMMLTSQGRAVGIHVICATQHPEVAVVPGRLKTNMGLRISGPMPNTSASMTILDIPDAARLPRVKGRMMMVSGMDILTLQAPLIEDHDIEYVVSRAQNEYPEVSDELTELADIPKPKVWDEPRVIQAALDWNNGSLSGSAIHKLLGDESPGERYLRTICKRITDRAVAVGGLLDHDGARYKLKRVTRGWALVFDSHLDKSDESDESDVGVSGVVRVQLASETPAPGQPLGESAAD